MNDTSPTIFIAYLSPAGSTAHVAGVIKRSSEILGTPAFLIDLSREPSPQNLLPRLQNAESNTCLYIGAPVYAGHAAPPVMEFIGRLPAAERGFCVPFVTWGNVSSGIALAEMGAGLASKGYPALGAAKVVARHSLMWNSENPLGKGRPDRGDDEVIAMLVNAVDAKLRTPRPAPIPLQELDYQPAELADQMAARTFEKAKSNYPSRRVATDRCTQCGLCAEQCPTAAITLDPYPGFGPACIYCFNCVRLCPEDAIASDLSRIREFIRNRSEQLDEKPLTRIFV